MLNKLKKAFPKLTRTLLWIANVLIFAGLIVGLILDIYFEWFFLLFPMIAGGALVFVLLFLLDYIIAGYFYFAAYDKGYREIAYLVIPFLMNAVGYLLVIALPDKHSASAQKEFSSTKEELPEL